MFRTLRSLLLRLLLDADQHEALAAHERRLAIGPAVDLCMRLRIERRQAGRR